MSGSRVPQFSLMSALLLLGLAIVIAPSSASAFPWDVDMFRQQSLKSGEIARAPAKGTVPRGHTPFTLTTEEAAEKLTNPIPASEDSLWRGRRIWNSNCAVCHGTKGDAKSVVGPQVAAPSLLEEFYKNSPDGKAYAVIHYGGANMPRYGFKLTAEDPWHVINYLRFLQGKAEVSNFPKPE